MSSSGTDEAYVAQRKLDRDDLVLEFMINALRLSSGFSYQQFEMTTGLGSEVLAEGVASAVNKGLLVVQGDSVQATDRGFRFLSEIQLLFT
jgi:oxygen-independent coproporphyrinogen-3 oxidase